MLNISANRLETVCWLIYFYFDITFLAYFSNSFAITQGRGLSLYYLILSWSYSLYPEELSHPINCFHFCVISFSLGITNLKFLPFPTQNSLQAFSNPSLSQEVHSSVRRLTNHDSQVGGLAPEGGDNGISRNVCNFEKLPRYSSLMLEFQSWIQNLLHSSCSYIQQQSRNL